MTAAELRKKLEALGILAMDNGPIEEDVAARIMRSLRMDAEANPAASLRPVRLQYSGKQGCCIPSWLERDRAWGITTQLYELRSKRSWGIGDFDDLRLFSEIAARAGADFVGVTPLHAGFLADPERCSPFAPSNRRFLNPLYIAVDRVSGYGQSAEIAATTLESMAASTLVDYARVSATKMPALRQLWKHWADDPALVAEHQAFGRFVEQEGRPLKNHALFEVVSAEMSAAGHGAGWKGWPQPYQDPNSQAIRLMADENADEIAFYNWVQWVAKQQLASVAAGARDAGMRIGLYLDMAVGEAPDGSAVWSDRERYLDEATIGAPPDYFSAEGQTWGLAAMTPSAIIEAQGQIFRNLIEHVSRNCGALRIDHVMALWQLFIIPAGLTPRSGAYVRYPIDLLLQILASLSHEAGFIVIGEDLGNVPEGFREVMASANVFSYRVLYFEISSEGDFLAAVCYPEVSLACVSTHDLPTLAGWWQGNDVELRHRHNLIDGKMADHQLQERNAERERLLAAIADELESSEAMKRPSQSEDELPLQIAVEVHRFLARSNAKLVGVRLADLAGEILPTNLPGTVDAYPNWRRRCEIRLDQLEEQPRFAAITGAVSEERPKS